MTWEQRPCGATIKGNCWFNKDGKHYCVLTKAVHDGEQHWCQCDLRY